MGDKVTNAGSCVSICSDVVTTISTTLREQRFTALVAPYEADAQVMLVERELAAGFIYANDVDLLVMGARNMISSIDFDRSSQGYLTEMLYSRALIIDNPLRESFATSALMRAIHGRDAQG